MSGRKTSTMAQRGSIGESWWSRRFIDPVEATGDRGRLSRGRSYARRGSVVELKIRPGVAVAKVEGSEPRPYTVTVGYLELDDGQWDTVCRALAEKMLYRSALLAGEMPHEIEDVFAEFGIALFPEDFGDLDVSCSCPDWGFPCKHAAAVLYVLADHFDSDPFAVLAWLGRDRSELLAAIRTHSPTGGSDGAGESGEEAPGDAFAVRITPLEERVESFWEADEAPTLEPRPMNPLAYLDDDRALVTSLRPLYASLAAETAPEEPEEPDAAT